MFKLKKHHQSNFMKNLIPIGPKLGKLRDGSITTPPLPARM